MPAQTRMLPGGGRERIRNEELQLRSGDVASVKKVDGGLVVTVHDRDFKLRSEKIVSSGRLTLK